MLQSMRKFAQFKIIKGLLVLLVLSFALWGIGDMFKGNPLQSPVAKAGKLTISVQALNQEFEQSLQQARRVFGQDLTAQQAKQLGMLDNTLNGMIERAEVDQDVKRLGIDVNTRTVLEQLAAQPQFQDKDGKFNKALFKQALEQSRISERQLVEQGRQELSRAQLLGVFGSNAKAPQSLADAVFKARGQKRTFDVIRVKNDSIANVPAPDEKVLREFYDKNPALFTAPEYRGITIARLSSDDLLKEIKITDEQVKQEYEAKGDQLARAESRDLLQVVLQSEEKAKELSVTARKSNNLSSAAKAMGYEAIPLNKTEEKTLLPELAQSVFAMQSNAVSEPIKSSLGWHVVQVKKIDAAGKPDFKAIRDELRETMQRDQAIETTTRLVNQVDDELAAGHSLEDIADAVKMRLIKIPAVDATGKTVDGKEPSELPNKADVLKTAFSQGNNEPSPVMDDKQGNYFVVRTDEVTASAVKPFEKVKDQIAAAWKKEEQAKRAAIEAEKIAKSLREGKAASSFAANGIEVRVSKPISKLGSTDAEIPQELLPQIFKLKKGEVTVSAQPGEQLLLRLASIDNIDVKEDDPSRLIVAGELGKQMPQELLDQYLKYLRIIFPVKVHQDVLDTIKQQGT